MKPERASMLRVFAGGVIISFSPVLYKVSGASPSAASFWRTAVGGAVLLALAVFRREKPLASLKRPGALALMGVIGILFTLDLEFWHLSVEYAGPGIATITANFQAILLAIIGVVVFKERFSPTLGVSIVLALAGLGLLVGIDVANLPPKTTIGVALGLGTAFWYSLYILSVRHSQGRVHRLPPAANMAWISMATALCVGLSGLARGADFSTGGPTGFAVLALYGASSQALGWLLISTGLPGFRASVAGLVILIQPTLAFTWDILFFDRPAGLQSLAGAIMALAAIYLGSLGARLPGKQAGKDAG